MRFALGNVNSDFRGFSSLVDLAAQSASRVFEDIEIDMSATNWFDANMCAPFGAVLYRASRALNRIRLVNIQPNVQGILSRNAFLSSYGGEKRPDSFGTTIEYTRFELKDGRYFASYIEKNLVGKGIPEMTLGLQKKFRESIFEIFNNAVQHSQTQHGIFGCGQLFPKKKRIDFAVADLGIGIRENVLRKTNLRFSAEQAVAWAMEGVNTTKTDRIPGGLGLKLLREFIMMNHGRIQIASDSGYWELRDGRVRTNRLPSPFPGTVVNLEINTADEGAYCLASETKLEDIF